jgi:patatin-like phospholipase/acyl hydrolase
MTFKILSLDGGGIRGIYSAHLLKRIQEELNIDFAKHFDLIVGTSTGSIIAAGLAIGCPIDDIYSFYEKESKNIFKPQFLNLRGFFKSKYSSKHLENLLIEIFGEKTLSETKTRLIIPATNISNGEVFVFKSNYFKEFVRDKNIKIVDAVLASCSAPVYFSPHKINSYLLADGGLWANNPSLVALTEAMSRLKKDKEDIKLLSIGTGIGKKYYKPSTKKRWGIFTGWKTKKLIDIIFNLQSKAPENMVKLLLPEKNYLRLNFETDTNLTMDDPALIADMLARADNEFTFKFKEIQKILTTN